MKRIETTPYYLKPSWNKNRYEVDQSLCENPKGVASDIKIYTDGSKKDKKVGCGVITPDQKFGIRLKSPNTVYGATQEAIIKVIYVI
jgi:hypothetical protein